MKTEINRDLIAAARSGNEQLVQSLLDEGADVNAKDRYTHTTPLHCAARKGNEALVRLLLNKGADVTAKDMEGGTALRWAVKNKHRTVARLLWYTETQQSKPKV